ncbi:hypothetical protein DPSP01_011113 [Paraphaeosphaeria sporulosa]|uniref:Cohesin loading factor-domain-containing protein n=1 Tax=Paraphaeosphaeria sporulosa TaxID=1460663 RepID=A0A177C421_9PLEO|nr:uncharacterized protein CC84DRAFT_1167808 [Paraphaeosphaeria sporulosa]OAG01632.1 hypothetical protein CC84DRAFT_1167808 [Paraphaeosphaeria sporulosa]
MDPRYNWPPQARQGYSNGQYVPSSQPNGYAPNGYSMPYGTQPPPMQPGFPASQQGQAHPRIAIPPRPGQQSPPQTAPQQRYMQPQVHIPQRNPNAMPQPQNQQMRQPQVHGYGDAQRPVQRADGGAAVDRRAQQQRAQTPAKPSHRPQSFQENTPRSQQRPVDTPIQNQNQYRAPLQPQGTPAHARTPTAQSRSPSITQSSSQVRSHPQVVIKTKPSTQLQTPTRSQHAPARPLPADLMVLILSAAEEYIGAARSLGSTVAMTLKPADLDQYYRLMATAMGCMETVLKKYNQTPRDEAILRLRYASLLVEETDNTQDIEEILAKGITLCNRSKLIDLKYAMLHLQARYQFKSNHRAALKMLDQPISEAETFKQIVWVYAFRFLKVSLALQVPGRPETSSALQQLHAIAAHAEPKGDKAIYVTCCALEAMIHLRSSASDRLEQAQRAIASARSLQLELSVKQLGSITILIDYIDVACSIQQGQPSQEKLTALQSKVDQNVKPDNGAFSVLIERSSAPNLTFSTGGVFRKADDGRDELVFAWLPRSDFGMLAYYLSGLVVVTKEKGTKYLQEGHALTQAALQRSSTVAVSVPKSLGQRNWIKVLDWHIKYTLGIAACYHEDKSTAQLAVSMLRERASERPFKGLETYARALSYLSGMVDQANGMLDSAIAIYSGSELNLPGVESGTNFNTDIALLAAMNRMLIIRDPSHPQHYLAQILYAQLQPLCLNHPNQYIDCAFRIIQAITQEESIKGHKTLIHTTTNRAQRLGNAQFVSMCLNYMASKFFANQVGEQPIKCARAARNVSSQGPVLWRAVAWGACIDTFQRNGLLEDAHNCQIAFEAIRDKLPPALRGEAPDADGDIDVM